jgi:hypothetical protein
MYPEEFRLFLVQRHQLTHRLMVGDPLKRCIAHDRCQAITKRFVNELSEEAEFTLASLHHVLLHEGAREQVRARSGGGESEKEKNTKKKKKDKNTE